jgi:hypothetical protein
VQILDLGGAVVVVDPDADAAALALSELREAESNAAPRRQLAVFVLEPGTSAAVTAGLREFCREQFGAEP